MQLDRDSPSMALPDLRRLIQYVGRTHRPDFEPNDTALRLMLLPQGSIAEIRNGECLYIETEADGNKLQYTFAPKGQVTPLWITAEIKGEEVLLTTHLIDELGEKVIDPLDRAHWTPRNVSNMQGRKKEHWRIGDFRADNTLFTQQRARWSGRDQFLIDFGGADYNHHVVKQRIQFGEENERYTIYITEGEGAVLIDGKWETRALGEKTRGLPLLYLKEIQERMLVFELWQAEGGKKVQLQLSKSPPDWSQIHEKKIVFSSVRTRQKVNLAIDAALIEVEVQDWLIIEKDVVIKIDTVEKIEHLLKGSYEGALFILKNIIEEEGKYYITGVFYDSSLSVAIDVKVPLGGQLQPSSKAWRQEPKRTTDY